MSKRFLRLLILATVTGAWAPAVATAQTADARPAGAASTICGQAVPAPAALPPAGSGPVVYQIAPCFDKQGNVSTVEPQTYLYYIQLKPSLPSQGVWVPYDEKAEDTIRGDFKRLWATNFLEDLAVDVSDYVFSNGVIGKLVTYDMEERQRIRVVDYVFGGKKLDRTKIEERLKERGVELRLDAFLDEGQVRRVEGILREMMAEEGYANAAVKHAIVPVAGGPKMVNISFTVGEGPKIRIRDVEFVGNSAIGDGSLQRKLKENKPKGILSFITGGGTYKESKFEEDAEKVLEHYRNEGYARARVGQPELKTLEDSKDGKTRWIQLRIPVTEGPRYRLGEFAFEGNTIVKNEGLRPLFKIEKGDWYNDKRVRDGLVKAREAYGHVGYMEFTGYPDMKFTNDGIEAEPDAALAAQVPEALAAPSASNGRPLNPTVDVTMRLQEGMQYFVNRIIFTGNSTTRDNVIRREMRLVEGGVFDTEALKYSVRRLNQLGYFKQLEGNDKDMKVDKTAGRANAVDVTLKVEEQNRNQLTFGAGVSQYEGVFGQLGFQTANFLGRGESLTLNIQAGQYTENYQLAFTEPFLFDRSITGGIDIYKRSLQYIGYYTQKSTGGNIVFGFPVADFSRMFVNYAYERTGVTDLNEFLLDQDCRFRATGCGVIASDRLTDQLSPAALENLRRNPFVFDSYLIGQGGRRTISKVVPNFVHNTIDNPIFPSQGKRLTASLDLAGLGGNTAFYKPMLEGIWYRRHLARSSFGGRAQIQYVAPYRGTATLPVFEKLVLGGEYSVRGYDIRSIGPSIPGYGVVVGGNKSLLFNAEYLITIAGPVRLVLFYDAGQVRDAGQSFGWKEDIIDLVRPPVPPLIDPFAVAGLSDPAVPVGQTRIAGRTSAFKTSTGAEIRFFMPVLNVPFRLIFAHNPQRVGVLDNSFRPAKKLVFRFAVGSTF